MKQIIIPVILCGGSGHRLWPARPKQFLPAGDGDTMLQRTAKRILNMGAAAGHIIAVTHAEYAATIRRDLAAVDPDAANHVLAEPCARNTAAAIVLAALYAAKTFGHDALLWIAPSDHYISDEAALARSLKTAEESAGQGWLTLFGIVPTRIETGYGYIACAADRIGEAYKVKSFIEKPDAVTS